MLVRELWFSADLSLLLFFFFFFSFHFLGFATVRRGMDIPGRFSAMSSVGGVVHVTSTRPLRHGVRSGIVARAGRHTENPLSEPHAGDHVRALSFLVGFLTLSTCVPNIRHNVFL